jgi:branched-subunit amino acid aminotransferase/4-amino-4-deoxychorismate lyase
LPSARYARLFREGARLVVPSIRQVPAGCVDPRIKQRSRMHWWLADRESQRLLPGATALLLNEMGHVTETAAANLLLVREGTILTPPCGTVLPGVSMQVTQELCGQLGIPFVEQPLTLEDCHQAQEALLCSTPYGVAGVRQIQGQQLAWPGPLTMRLRQAWDDLVGLNIQEQILSVW